MAEPFIAEIRIASFDVIPRGWAPCNGQLLPINQNPALFAVLGTTYGGDGITNFALPNLQGRAPLHVGDAVVLGQAGGEASHLLSAAEIPPHTHALMACSDPATTSQPSLAEPAAKAPGGVDIYAAGGSPPVALSPQSIAPAAAAPHDNMQPYLSLNFMIALQGIFPTRD